MKKSILNEDYEKCNKFIHTQIKNKNFLKPTDNSLLMSVDFSNSDHSDLSLPNIRNRN